MKTLTLRGHHLLCSRLFNGNGYNEEFAMRMGEAVSRMSLKNYQNPIEYNKAEEIFLICGSDYVCEKCPNLINEKGCMLGTDDVFNKDILTIKYAGLEENKKYKPEDIEKAVKNINKAQFEEICGTCRWHKAGYCSFEKLQGSSMDYVK